MDTFYQLLSFLPILSLLVLSLRIGVKGAVMLSLLITSAIFFISGSTPAIFAAALIAALANTLSILMIIFGAVFLYQVMDQNGFIQKIQSSLESIHPDRSFRFFFLALFLTAFFESVAGFGTPGAIVPLLLVALGYSPVLSIATVLLLDGCFAMSGALGTPMIAGLELPLGLSAESISRTYGIAAGAVSLSGLIGLAFIYRALAREQEEKPNPRGWILYLALLIPYAATISVFHELSGLLAPLAMAIFAYLFFFQDKRLQWKTWLPYHLLVLLLLLPKIIPPFATFLTWKWEVTSLFGTAVSASLQPLRSPLVPFLLAGCFALALSRAPKLNFQPVLSKTVAVFIILFPSLAITQLMIHSGGELPSMVDSIALVFAKAGQAYPLFSPMIGIIGTFLTGSTTVSNVIFGPVQMQAAQSLEFPLEVILGLQLAGASIGNAVCLFNIIAAAAVVGLPNYAPVLKKNLPPRPPRIPRLLPAGLLPATLMGAPRTPPSGHDAYASWRHRNFVLYAIGGILVQIGGGAQTLAIGWEMYQRTGEALSLGMVGLVQAIPLLLLTLVAGYIADRFPRIWVMAISMVGTTATSIGLAVFSAHEGSIFWMYVLLLLDATFMTLGRPARTAVLPLLVPRESFQNAIAWRTSLGQISSVVGPALGGFVLAWYIPAAYLFAAATSTVFLCILPWIKIRQEPMQGQSAPTLETLFAGVKYVWTRKVILSALTLDLFAVLLGGAVYLLPIYAIDILHVGETGLGYLRAAPAVGALLTALLIAHSPPMKRSGRNMLLAVAAFGAVTIVFGFSTNFWLSWAMLFLTGVFDNISVVVRHTLIQILTPDSMRGRVSAVSSIFIGASNEIGGFESGVVAQWFGAVFSVVSGGIGSILVTATIAWKSPALRKFGRLDEEHPPTK